jgi:long-subunit fatty acid transport protein
MDEITFKTAGVKVRNKTYYENCWLMGLGMEYRTKNNLIIRLGLKYDQGVPENRGLNPASNDIDLLTPSIGFAYPLTQSTEISLSGLAAFGFEKKYNEAKYEQNLLSFTIGLRFKFS